MIYGEKIYCIWFKKNNKQWYEMIDKESVKKYMSENKLTINDVVGIFKCEQRHISEMEEILND